MAPAVEVVLTGWFCQFTARAILTTRGFRGFKLSRKPVPQAGASPQQAEPLAAAGGNYQQTLQPNKKIST